MATFRVSVPSLLIAVSSLCLALSAACSDDSDGGGGSSNNDDDCSGPFCPTSDDDGDDDSPADDDDGVNECTESLDSEADSCSVCLAESCCGELLSFEDASGSDAFLDCVTGCATEACLEGCFDDYPQATAAFNDFSQCDEAECSSPCSEDEPVETDNECLDTSETDVCVLCDQMYCCSEMVACADNTSCTNLVSCLADCSTDTCSENCVTSYSGGVDLLMDFGNCHEDQCSSVCG